MSHICIILTINSIKYLPSTLNSIFTQEYDDFEVIILDNVHSDFTDRILYNYKYNEHLICVERVSEENSLNNLKNEIISTNESDYLLFMTSHTILSYNFMESVTEYSVENNENMISFNSKIVSEHQDPTMVNYYENFGVTCAEKYGIPFLLSRNLFKRDFLVDNSIFFNDEEFASEELFLSNVLINVGSFLSLPCILSKEIKKKPSLLTYKMLINYLKCYHELLIKFSTYVSFTNVLESVSKVVIKLIDMPIDEMSYKEFKFCEIELNDILKICSENNYSFSYEVKRSLRYLRNKLYNRVTDFDVGISIIIPSYNVEDYLDDCLVSLINQSFENFEVIIVDDSSTDSTVEIIKYYEKLDHRIKFVKKERKSGSGGSRNYAMKYARGKYIQFLDADDWLDLDTLEKLYSYAEKHETDMVIFKLINYDTFEKTFFKNRYYSIPSLNGFENKVFNLDDVHDKLFKIAVSPVNKLYSRTYLESINAEFPEKYVHQDNPFFYQTFCDAQKVYLTDEYFYNRRRTDSSISTKRDGTQIGTIEIVEYMLNVFINNKLYETFKKPLLNRLIFKIRNRSKQVGEEFKEEYYRKAKRKFHKFVFRYGLNDDLKENLTRDNKTYFENILYSENYEKFLELK